MISYIYVYIKNGLELFVCRPRHQISKAITTTTKKIYRMKGQGQIMCLPRFLMQTEPTHTQMYHIYIYTYIHIDSNYPHRRQVNNICVSIYILYVLYIFMYCRTQTAQRIVNLDIQFFFFLIHIEKVERFQKRSKIYEFSIPLAIHNTIQIQLRNVVLLMLYYVVFIFLLSVIYP